MFKLHSSTILCSTLNVETIEPHNTHDSCQPAHVLLLDASKAFYRVCNNELFLMLIERNQYMCVRWKDSLSNHSSIGMTQGAVLSPLLFTLSMLFIRLHDLGFGCHVGPIFAGSFVYANNVVLASPTIICHI